MAGFKFNNLTKLIRQYKAAYLYISKINLVSLVSMRRFVLNNLISKHFNNAYIENKTISISLNQFYVIVNGQ